MGKTRIRDQESLALDLVVSLMELANVLSESEAKVLCGLIRKLRHELGMWKSDATRRELKESTGLSFKTIQR